MYHKVPEQEAHPENYVLKEMDKNWTEDECFDLLSRPRHTQNTIGLYLKRIKGTEDTPIAAENECVKEKKRFSLAPGSEDLESEVYRNKGFWVGRPEHSAPMMYKLYEKYSTDGGGPRPAAPIKDQGIFYRPKYFELQHTINLAKAGLLFPDEEISEEEEEIQQDETGCTKLRKVKYKLCDPCKEVKEKKEKKEKKEEVEEETGMKPLYKKIPTGCHCDYYWAHNQPPSVWDLPYLDEIDMQRQHEMNKVLRPWKHELLSAYYEKNPPVKVMAQEPGKRTFPIYQISNL